MTQSAVLNKNMDKAALGAQLRKDGIIIRTWDLMKTYVMGDQTIHAVAGVDIEIRKGEYVAIMGPSGSGKSTLMNLIGCLDSPSSGLYYLNGSLVSDMDDDELAAWRNAHVGFIFQNYNLVPVLNAFENVELPLLLTSLGSRERRRQVEVAEKVFAEAVEAARQKGAVTALAGRQSLVLSASTGRRSRAACSRTGRRRACRCGWNT